MKPPTTLKLAFFLLALALLLGTTPVAVAAPGDLDPSFGEDGMVTTGVSNGFIPADGARAVVVDSAGRIVAGGYANVAGQPVALVRYQADGTLDASFGTGGIAFGGPTLSGGGGLALDAVGRIIAVGPVGETGGKLNFAVARYLPDGALDPSFGDGGKVIVDIGGLSRDDRAHAVTVDPLGRILVAGCHDCGIGRPNKFALVRYLDSGAPDPGFGIGGLVLADFGYAVGPGQARAVVLDASGRIIVGGGRILARFMSEGTLDATFNSNGWLYVDFPAARSGEIWAAALDAEERILIVGEIDNQVTGTGVDFAVARYATDGTPDPTFGGDGWVTTDFLATDFLGDNGHDDLALAAVIDPKGRIVVTGLTYRPYPEVPADFAVARYREDGTLDPQFGLCGRVITDFGDRDMAYDVALDAVGRMIVVGESGQDFALARYLDSGIRITAIKQNTAGAPIKDWLMTLAGPEPQTGKTRWNGCATWAVTQPGTYTLTEEDQAGWTPQGATSVELNVAPGDGFYSHTFVNFKDVQVTACKRNTRGSPIKDWLMTLAGPDPKSGQTLGHGCVTWTVTRPGDYTMTEEDRPGWVPRGAVSVDFAVTSGSDPYSHTFVNSEALYLPLIMRQVAAG